MFIAVQYNTVQCSDIDCCTPSTVLYTVHSGVIVMDRMVSGGLIVAQLIGAGEEPFSAVLSSSVCYSTVQCSAVYCSALYLYFIVLQ